MYIPARLLRSKPFLLLMYRVDIYRIISIIIIIIIISIIIIITKDGTYHTMNQIPCVMGYMIS